ncbi:MAG: hypothetical protein HOP28_06525 [Gemmatimonadales bacterium]|nr:hypothetical protein [Gemmatimonadales bacterium]
MLRSLLKTGGLILVGAFIAGESLEGQAPTVTVGGVGYLSYVYQLKDTANQLNTFDVARSYVNVLGTFAYGVKTRITSDIYRVADGSLALRLKYGFVSWTPEKSALTFKMGMTQTPLVDWEEALWEYRMQGNIALDRNGYLTSSDIGVAVDGSWGFDRVSASAGLYNGESYNKAPGDKRKDVAARVSVRVKGTDEPGRVGGLRLTGFAHYGTPTTGGKRQRFAGIVSYRSKALTLAAELAATKDSVTAPVTALRNGRLITTFGVYKIPSSKFAVIGRLDLLDPNTKVDEDRQTRIIAGVSYTMSSNLRVLLDLDHLSYQAGSTTPALEAVRSQALFQVQFTF